MRFLLVAMSLAHAGAPDAVVLPSQGVQGTVSVSLSPADAMARLADPTWVSSIDGGRTTVVVTGHDGACTLAAYTSPSALMTVTYTIRQCPTGSGYRSLLVSSDDFETYESEWIVAPDGAGSLLTYRVRLEPKLPIPLALMTGTIRRDVLSMMEHFDAAFHRAP